MNLKSVKNRKIEKLDKTISMVINETVKNGDDLKNLAKQVNQVAVATFNLSAIAGLLIKKGILTEQELEETRQEYLKSFEKEKKDAEIKTNNNDENQGNTEESTVRSEEAGVIEGNS